jgi:hypothetical protein
MNFDLLAASKRALLVNAAAVIGVGVGFASADSHVSPDNSAPLCVFTLALVNLMFLIVRPRILANIAEGKATQSGLRIILDLVRERPFIVLLVLLQFVGVSRSVAAAVSFIQSSSSAYVGGLPNASTIIPRLIVMSGAMTVVAGIWLFSAIGMWRNRPWGWWLTLVLNGLAASVTGFLQLFSWSTYLLDTKAIAALILLLLPTVRSQYRGIREHVQLA